MAKPSSHLLKGKSIHRTQTRAEPIFGKCPNGASRTRFLKQKIPEFYKIAHAVTEKQPLDAAF